MKKHPHSSSQPSGPLCSQEDHSPRCRHFGKYGTYLGSHDADCVGSFCICRPREQERVRDAVAQAISDKVGGSATEIASLAISVYEKEHRNVQYR